MDKLTRRDLVKPLDAAAARAFVVPEGLTAATEAQRWKLACLMERRGLTAVDMGLDDPESTLTRIDAGHLLDELK